MSFLALTWYGMVWRYLPDTYLGLYQEPLKRALTNVSECNVWYFHIAAQRSITNDRRIYARTVSAWCGAPAHRARTAITADQGNKLCYMLAFYEAFYYRTIPISHSHSVQLLCSQNLRFDCNENLTSVWKIVPGGRKLRKLCWGGWDLQRNNSESKMYTCRMSSKRLFATSVFISIIFNSVLCDNMVIGSARRDPRTSSKTVFVKDTTAYGLSAGVRSLWYLPVHGTT